MSVNYRYHVREVELYRRSRKYVAKSLRNLYFKYINDIHKIGVTLFWNIIIDTFYFLKNY